VRPCKYQPGSQHGCGPTPSIWRWRRPLVTRRRVNSSRGRRQADPACHDDTTRPCLTPSPVPCRPAAVPERPARPGTHRDAPAAALRRPRRTRRHPDRRHRTIWPGCRRGNCDTDPAGLSCIRSSRTCILRILRIKKSWIFTNLWTQNECYLLHVWTLRHRNRPTALLQRDKLKLPWPPYHHSGWIIYVGLDY